MPPTVSDCNSQFTPISQSLIIKNSTLLTNNKPANMTTWQLGICLAACCFLWNSRQWLKVVQDFSMFSFSTTYLVYTTVSWFPQRLLSPLLFLTYMAFAILALILANLLFSVVQSAYVNAANTNNPLVLRALGPFWAELARWMANWASKAISPT